MTPQPNVSDFASTVTVSGTRCPSCGSNVGRTFYSVEDVPVHEVYLVRSRDSALNFTKGDISLRFCESCGFIWNEAFDPDLLNYDAGYESTQAVSPTFNRFHAELASDIVERYDLIGREVLEIGCGQGEFLSLLCDRGIRRAHGFDPVIRDGASPHPSVTLTKEWYTEVQAGLHPDFVFSKMVMEHIPDPGRFLHLLRRTVGGQSMAIVFCMMPEVRRILQLRSFWDIFYEHCAYYSLGSLARAFRVAEFDPIDLRTGFDKQYALIGARIGTGQTPQLNVEKDLEDLAKNVDDFSEQAPTKRAAWVDFLQSERARGRHIALWGGGSKGVAFLTTLGIRDEIEVAVDINPMRDGMFIAGTGQPIISPNRLKAYRPDLVLISSPIYTNEIAASLRALDLHPRLVSIEDEPWKRQAA